MTDFVLQSQNCSFTLAQNHRHLRVRNNYNFNIANVNIQFVFDLNY